MRLNHIRYGQRSRNPQPVQVGEKVKTALAKLKNSDEYHKPHWKKEMAKPYRFNSKCKYL